MNIVCGICRDLLVPSSDVFHTPCGHIFHLECLTEWLKRSKTCPQCRERTTESKIHRLYFNFSNDSNVEDASVLEQKIDNLTFQLNLKEKNISNLTETQSKLQSVTKALREEIKHVESEIKSKNCAIAAFKDQLKFYKQECEEVHNQKREISRLKKHIENLKNLQNLIDASVDEVDERLGMISDPNTLITYISVMKREMTVSFNKRRELRDKVSKLQREVQQLAAKCASLSGERSKRKELEEQLIICESEKIHLQNQLHNEQKKAHKCVCKVLKEKPDSLQEEYSFEEESNTETKIDDAWEVEANDSCTIVEPDNITEDSIENTPRNVKSYGFSSMKNRGIKRTNSDVKVPSILAKKPKFNQSNQKFASSGVTFDGFGGHAKYDKFPSPTLSFHMKKVRDESKTKKPKLDTGDNQKLSDILLV
ncbi:TRAF-interacting protein [Ooceraea biroi]|uniref:TRAF-interacting protein n=1 Tax=Ooceraea biroi TaxID=2015173 RepID=A0A026WQ86_OOCBI|nr:TRAF-interacting protein [Ooceraea biroi]